MTDKEAKQAVVMTKKEVCGVLGIKESALLKLERVAKLQPRLQGYTAREARLLAATLTAILPPATSR
jgi:hypothetical protein